MKLNWKYDVENRTAKAVITDNLFYTCSDGGQTINKFVDGQQVKTFHKYGPDNKFCDISPQTGLHLTPAETGYQDDWPHELAWLSKSFPNVVGSYFNPEYTDGFINKFGDLEDLGTKRGMGVTDNIEKISINRMASPANEVEWWDWETIATGPDVAEDCMGRGTWWRKNKNTGEIVRTSGGTPPYPCCVHPVVHGPYVVDESDIDKHGGKRLN